jgi:general secretion pathway protein J
MIVRACRAPGFTLIEVLVAIALLAILALMAWRGLDQVVAQRDRMEARTAESERVLRTLAQLERDLAMRVPDRLFAGRYGVGGALPLALELTGAGEGRDTLRVLRLQPDQEPRGVTYAVEEGRLVRTLGDVRGEAPASPVVMLEGVRRFDLRVLIGSGWVAPQEVPANLTAGIGAALQITIEQDGGLRYVQVVAL